MPQRIDVPGMGVVEFPDGMSDDQISAAIKSNLPQDSLAGDVAKSAGIGLAHGTISLAGLPGDARSLASNATDWVGGKLGASPEGIAQFKAAARMVAPSTLVNAPTSSDLQKGVEKQTGAFYEPKTAAGRYTKSIAEFAPGLALGGGGGVVRNAVRYAVAPGIASQAAEDVSKGTGYEPYARVGGALLGGGAASVASRPGAPARVMSEAMGGTVTEQAVNAAAQLRNDAAARGITLTWPEAIQQVTGGATKLADVQRVAEGSQAGGAILRPVMAQRAGQVDQAVQQNLNRVAAPGADPFMVGPRAAEAATNTLEDVQAAINRHTRPLYQAAELERVPAAIVNEPAYQHVLGEIRRDPIMGPQFAHMPDNGVGIADEVQKRLRDMGGAAQRAGENYRGSVINTAAADTRNAGTRASPDYAYALAEQARLRGQHLEPLQQGPLGRAAEAQTTEGAVNALLPNSPLPGSIPQTGQAFRAIGARNPDAASNVVRQKMEGTYNQAGKDLQGGANEWGGANYAARLFGNPQARENVRTAITETAGPAATADTDALMRALQATGRRQHAGSQTEFNRLMTGALESGGAVGEALSGAAGKFNPLAALRDRYQQFRYGANTDALARALLDATPAQVTRMSQAAAGNDGVTRALALALFGYDGARREPLRITVSPQPNN